MENLLLSPEEHEIVLKYKNFLEGKFNVNISLPEKLSPCSRDVMVATVVGERISCVKNFICKRLEEIKRKQEQRIAVQNNVTTIILSDSDSDDSSPATMATQQKRKKGPNRKKRKRSNANNQSNQLVDFSSIILIEDSEESANENSIHERSNAEKENSKFEKIESVSVPIKVEAESPITSTNFMRLGIPHARKRTSKDNTPDNTIILSDSPPPPDFLPLGSEKEEKNIPNEIEDSDIIIEDEIRKPIVIKPRRLRPIVIDGSNVAREHGKVGNTFSCKGIQIAINYFLRKGHEQVTAFVPLYRRHNKFGPVFTTDQPLLEELAKDQRVVFTPSRRIENRTVSCYDDRFIVELATQNGGVILSNDNYRDIAGENEEFKKTINERLLMFCFVGDIIMIPQDPLGRNGPSLENFLSFPN